MSKISTGCVIAVIASRITRRHVFKWNQPNYGCSAHGNASVAFSVSIALETVTCTFHALLLNKCRHRSTRWRWSLTVTRIFFFAGCQPIERPQILMWNSIIFLASFKTRRTSSAILCFWSADTSGVNILPMSWCMYAVVDYMI
jgi:hypothetical protein